MRNRGHFKKFLASGRALLSAVVTVAVILGGVVLLPSAVRAEEKEFKGFGNHGAAISEDGRYYSNGYIEKINGKPNASYNRFAIITADGGNSEADSFAFCLANGKKFPTHKTDEEADGVYRMVRDIDEDMYAKLLAENHKFSHIANKKLAWETFSRLAYIYLADPTGIVKRTWGKTDDATISRARDAFHQVIQLEIWRYTDGFLVSPTQNYFEYKYLSNEQKKALELVRQDLWNFAVPYDKLEYRFYKPEFKRGAGYQALGTVRLKKNDITVNKVWLNLDPTDKKPDTYVRLLNDRKPVMVTDPGTGKQKEAVQKIDSEADQAVFEGEFNLDSGFWEVEEVMSDGKGGWKHWEVPGYTSDNLVRFDGRHCTITNTKNSDPKVVKVRKFWFNMDESTPVPNDVYFTLYKNGTKVADPKKLEKNAVSVEFPIDNSADIKQYTVKETDATGNPWKKDGYDEPVITKVLDGVFEVSNEKKDPPKVKVKVKKVDKDQPDKLLVGANLMIEKIYKQDIPSKYPDADWQTTGKVDEVELPAGDYKLSEQEPPLGYKKAANIYFKVDDQGNVSVSGTDPKGLYVASIDKTITMADEKDTTTGSKLADVKLSKKAADGKELPGAKLQVVQIVSKQGQNPYSKLVEEWTSDKDKGAKTIKLPEGEYMMVETTAPNGYEVAESITFKVDAKGKVSVRGENGNFVNQGDSTVTMIDKPKQQEEKTFSVNLSKKAVNGMAELPGAEIKVFKGYSENGLLVKEWTSGTSSMELQLAPGVYTMVETTAPNGYEVAENITFKVDADGKVSVLGKDGKFGNPGDPIVTMFDKPKQPGKKYKVTFPKGAETSEDDPDGKNTTLKIVEGEDPNGQTTVGNPWNPGTEDKITELKPGTYTLVKVVKKDGGKDVTETVTFKVDNNGEISVKNKDGDFVKKDDKTITTKDKEKTTPQQPGGKHKVTFPKDAETSEDDPKGEHTTLKIVEGEDPNGNTTVGESWKPGKEDKNVDLKPGTYTLVKVVEKDGRQEVTESVTFKVDTNGEILVKNKDGKYVKKDGNTITTKDKEKTTPQQPGEEPSQNHGTLFPPVILQQPGSTDTSQQAEVTKKTAKLSSTQGEVTPQADVPKTGEATTQPILPVFLTLAGLILVGVVVRRQKKQAPTKD